jgi:Aerotolerance regulator N-terminal/von Willebrand factor type A domain
MSFLAPLFLLGAAAIALPVLFHLIRRSSKEQIPFSSLMFLKPAPPRVTKRSRLEHIFLLLLRCLVLCLLALGFARPFIQKPMAASSSPDTSRKLIVLVDTSASMRREGLWSDAVSKAGEALRNAAPGEQVAVFTFDSRVRPLLNFEQWTAMNEGERGALASARLAALKPGWGSTHLGNALTAAAEAFADADKQGQNLGRRRIILITDFQEGSRLDGLQGYEWPRGVEVEVRVVQPKKPTNAGLQWLVENNDTANARTNNDVRIRVVNSPNATREQFQLRWDGVAGALPLDVYVPPGQSRIVPAPALPANTTGERLVLTGDDDDFDNTISVLQPRAERVNVLFVGDEPENDSTQPLFYLKRAFQQTLREIIEVRVRPASAPLAAADLADTRLLIATDRLPDSVLGSVRDFMTNGGTVLFALKNAAAAGDAGRLAGVDGLGAEEATVANYAMFGQIDFEHPLFAPFSDPRFNDFTKIHFWKYRRLDAGKWTGARVLAKFDSGDPALLEVPRGKGRLLVLASGWQPADSQLALSSKFVPLLYAMLDLSGGIRSALTQFHTGEEVNLAGFAPSAGQAIAVRKPDGAPVQLAAGETRFSQTDLPGIYTVTSVEPPVRFAVNLDTSESRTAPLPADTLERLGVPMKAPEIAAAVQIEHKRQLHDNELEERQKLWRWLTLAALAAIVVETWAAGWLSRRATFQTGVET